MKVRIQKVSSTALYVMLAITLVILGVFFFGGETPLDQRIVADPALSEPAQTDALIYWMYILLAVTDIVTVGAAIFQFVSGFIESPKNAIKSLYTIYILMAVMILLIFGFGIAKKFK